MPTAYASPVTTHHLPSRSDSTALSNGNKPSTETEKQDERSDKSEVQQEPSQLNISDATALSNGKSDAESPSSETKKDESSDNASQLDNSGKQGSSDNAS